MNNFTLTGTIIDVMDAQSFGKGFRKREFVILVGEPGDKYSQKILFTLIQDKCAMIDSYGIGDTITVSFDVKGRDWTDKYGQVKYFTTLEANNIFGEKRAEATPSQMTDDDILDSLFPDTTRSMAKAESIDLLEAETVEPGSSEDDLPF